MVSQEKNETVKAVIITYDGILFIEDKNISYRASLELMCLAR